MIAAFATPLVQSRVRRQWRLVVVVMGLYAATFAGLIAAPMAAPYLWATLLGVCQGAALSLALGFIVARAANSHHAAHLSTMAQGVGYLIAAAGPFLFGALHSLSSGWTVPLLFLAVVLVPMSIVGLAASRRGQVLR
jgi:CP family cyanate transporter-like MFS transporter